VESDPEAVSFLRSNAARAESTRFTICDGSAAEWMSWVLDRGVDAAIVDPPRKGLEDSVLEGLAARPVPLLLYLSCNPATLARDLRRLQAAYRVVSLRGYDFFPHTPHIETLAILESR
jgi:tRNA/tmRNA/rRNA uracil-C5-methylase (TrmA/RlmC/RlmD family)